MTVSLNTLKGLCRCDLRGGDCPGLSEWAQCNHKGLAKREAEGQRQSMEDGYTAGLKMEEGAVSLQKLENTRKQRNAAMLTP